MCKISVVAGTDLIYQKCVYIFEGFIIQLRNPYIIQLPSNASKLRTTTYCDR